MSTYIYPFIHFKDNTTLVHVDLLSGQTQWFSLITQSGSRSRTNIPDTYMRNLKSFLCIHQRDTDLVIKIRG